MVVSEGGTVIDVSKEHPENDPSPMVVTEEGIVTDLIEEHP